MGKEEEKVRKGEEWKEGGKEGNQDPRKREEEKSPFLSGYGDHRDLHF
ncbi:hypothetical protein PVA38_10455 [Streptococcus pneumoniae D39]|nr:hypothetical protein PVA38_10455 [Streptococcus pneumoniae D39]